MKMHIKCDSCGVVVAAEAATETHDGRDLCDRCALQAKLRDLKQEHASKLAWLESTHLQHLRELGQQILDTERELRALPPPPTTS